MATTRRGEFPLLPSFLSPSLFLQMLSRFQDILKTKLGSSSSSLACRTVLGSGFFSPPFLPLNLGRRGNTCWGHMTAIRLRLLLPSKTPIPCSSPYCSIFVYWNRGNAMLYFFKAFFQLCKAWRKMTSDLRSIRKWRKGERRDVKEISFPFFQHSGGE